MSIKPAITTTAAEAGTEVKDASQRKYPSPQMEIIDLILVHIEDPMIRMRFVHPRHIDVVILRNHPTVIVTDTEKDVNVLLVSVPPENSPHDDHLVHEVIPNHQFLATVLNVEKMMDIFIN